jgi:prepilin-type N-terminal cleavage/methylation domain-containing protein
MFATMRRMHREEKGFTLVELLIVVTILGILAAVVTTSLIGLTATAKTNACAEELRTVQTAMDAMMATKNITTVTANATASRTWTALPAGAGADPLSPNYIRQSQTKGAYTFDGFGAVTAVAGAAGVGATC